MSTTPSIEEINRQLDQLINTAGALERKSRDADSDVINYLKAVLQALLIENQGLKKQLEAKNNSTEPEPGSTK